MEKFQTAPRCVQCHSECPNGLVKFPELAVCQNPECPNYWIFQCGESVMKELDNKYPYK
jgi:hypothetical protein